MAGIFVSEITGLQMPPPEQTQNIPGTGHDGMGHGMGAEKGGIIFTNHREDTGIEMVGFQPVRDITDGVKMSGIEIEAQTAQHGHRKFSTGEGFSYSHLNMQRRKQSGQMVIQITVCLGTHGGKGILKLIPLTGGEGNPVQPGIGSDALVAVAAGMLGNKAAVEGGAVIPAGKGIEIAQIFLRGDGHMVVRIAGDGTDKASHAIGRCGEKNIKIFLLTVHGTPPSGKHTEKILS